MLPLQKFIGFIKKNALFTDRDKILLAVSGGKDSVLMVQLFKLAGYQFSIAHCNFNLRGDEAKRDETFVKLLAASLGVTFHVASFETQTYATEAHVSIQMAARTLRYAWFEELSEEFGYHAIALAQHQNDSIETLLLNLVRGTGISGLHGILPKRDNLIRPLLFLSRQEIDDVVAENNIDFVTDSSNESRKYARNQIRLSVVPQLREINPNLEETFVQNIERFAEMEALLNQVVAEKSSDLLNTEQGDIHIAIEKIKTLTPKKLLLFELLKPYHFTGAVIEEILNSLDKISGTSFYSATHRATINRTELIVSAIDGEAAKPQFLHANAEHVTIAQHRLSISVSSSKLIETTADKAFVDFEKLIFPLVVRFKQDGDRFMPLGMNNFKKISDFLIGIKVSLPQKNKIPLLVNGNGEIIWVAGLRQDNRYKVNATTKKVAIFELLKFDGTET